MIFLYRFITWLVYLIIYPYGRAKSAGGSLLWQGRLGLIPHSGPTDVWVHAASVGEVKVIMILVDRLRRKTPDLRIHVTVMTAAGFKTAATMTDQTLTVSFFPLDAVGVVKRTLDRLKPRIIVVAETEIWPNLIQQVSNRAIPIMLVNGRMTERSFRKYRLFRRSLARLFDKYHRFFFKTEEDKKRYGYFGVSPEKTKVVGDMKFDAPVVERSTEGVAELRRQLGIAEDGYLVVAGSTRQGEEAILVDIYGRLKAKHPNIRLLLAPRHLERVDEICSDMAERGEGTVIYSGTETELQSLSNQVIVVNRMGLLNDLYMVADLAFVGGTMVPLGGHNILEPVWAGTPVLFGKSLDNVGEAAEYVISHNYGAVAESAEQLHELIRSCISGERKFVRKTANDRPDSPAMLISDFVLECLDHV